jgi:hypothetical protein
MVILFKLIFVVIAQVVTAKFIADLDLKVSFTPKVVPDLAAAHSHNPWSSAFSHEKIWKHSPAFKENIESSHTMNIQDNGYTCQSLPETYSPFMTCSGLVDYSFLVAPSASLESMELEAQTMAGYYSSLSSMLPNTCVSSIKKAICASIYLPCIPSIMTGKAI